MKSKFENLHSCIEFYRKKFIEIQEKYNTDKYELEFEDAKYKEDEINIFRDARFKKLSKFIEAEAKLYRVDNLHYSEIKDTIDRLILDINNWNKSLQYRKIQGISEARRVYNSEKYYLRDMVIRLHYYSSILDCLIDMEKVELLLLDQGKEISADPEYEVFLLNRCILLNQVDYCRKECTVMIIELNNRVNNSSRFNCEFLYKLGELNFELQNFNEAQLFLDRAIRKLEAESNDDMIIGAEKEIINDMLFSAYQLQVLGYEFCGQYDKAIYLLVEDDQFLERWDSNAGLICAQKVVKIFNEKLAQYGGVEVLTYSSDDTESARQKRKNIIKWLDEVVQNDLFQSAIFCYVHKKSNQVVFNHLVDMENEKLQRRIFDCKNGKDEKKRIVYETNKILPENNIILYEYIHILAHCLNEYGVTCFRNNCKTGDRNINFSREDEVFIQNLILIGRALMLYVSDKLSIYKTCYATTYAEAGDFEIAKNELENVLKSDKYKNADVTTKAEIVFFTYLINSLDRIERGDDYQFWKKEELYDRYLNYCYRSFDYDAIAHIKVYDFRHSMAFIMQHSELKEMADQFFSFIESKDVLGKTPYERFVTEVYFQNTNRRLKCEYEKVKYMYHFLESVLERFKSDAQTTLEADNINNGRILDYAFKYMHFHNLLLDDSNDDRINYVVNSDLSSIVKVFPHAEIVNNRIISEYCELIFLDSDERKREFIETISIIQRNKPNKMFFVVCENPEMLKQRLRKDKGIRVNSIKNMRFFDSHEKGLYEFIVLNTFFYIKNDFSDPKNIFILTPIDTAKSCKYRVCGDVELIANGFSKEYKVTLDQARNMSTQYNAVAERFSNEESWENQLNDSKIGKEIMLIISMMYDKESDTSPIKYRYKYNVFEQWKEAMLFLPKSFMNMIIDLYDDDVCDRIKIHKGCRSPRNSCSIQMIENIQEWHLYGNNFWDFTKSFPEIDFSKVEKLLLWSGENGSFVSWRMVFVKNNANQNNVNKIKQLMCCLGRGLQFSAKKNLIRYNWPQPFDFEKYSNNFLFVCHSGNDDEFVKKELNEFFVSYNIPIWYDKDKFISDEGWKKRIESIIQERQCVGCVLLITNCNFFDSEAIQFEILKVEEEIKKCSINHSKKFSVMPIVYGINKEQTNSNVLETLRTMMRSSISDLDTMTRIERCVIPGDDKVITYLNKNQSLVEYTRSEVKKGRNASILKACAELNIKLKEDLS